MKIVSLLLIILFVSISCDSKKETPFVSDRTVVKQIPVDAPAWYRELPQSEEFIYGKGMAISKRVNIARDKALIQAQADLAEKISDKVLSTEMIELNQGIIKEQQNTQDGDRWRVYVLLEMPSMKVKN